MNKAKQDNCTHLDQDWALEQTAFKVVGIKPIIWIKKGWEISCSDSDFVVM
jgi:hypothetical protein